MKISELIEKLKEVLVNDEEGVDEAGVIDANGNTFDITGVDDEGFIVIE